MEGRSSLTPSGTVRSVHTIEKGLIMLSPRFAGDVARLSRLRRSGRTKLPYKQLHSEWKQVVLLSLFKDIHC